MAENKKSVILYIDIITTFEKLEDDEAGRLIKHFLRYVNDLNPEPPDKLTMMVFEPIKQQLKRDLVKWEEIKQSRSEAGRVGGLKSAEAKASKLKQNQANVEKVKQSQANQAVTVNVNDTVNDTLFINIKKLFLNDFNFSEKICRDKNLQFDVVKKYQEEFINDIELKEDFKELKELKNHFINWLNLKIKILKNGSPGAKSTVKDRQLTALKGIIETGKAQFAALRKEGTGT